MIRAQDEYVSPMVGKEVVYRNQVYVITNWFFNGQFRGKIKGDDSPGEYSLKCADVDFVE